MENIGQYFVTVSEALFWVNLGYFGWVGVDVALFWVSEVGGKIFWVGGAEWGWVHSLIMPDLYISNDFHR